MTANTIVIILVGLVTALMSFFFVRTIAKESKKEIEKLNALDKKAKDYRKKMHGASHSV
jgi:hypothetical protein